MAHDDLLFPDHLERLGPLFERPEVEWAYSRPLWIEDDGTIIPFALDLRRPAELHSFLRKGNKVPASCVAHRRALLERYGYWSEERMKAGDWELWTRMVGPSRGTNIDYQPVPTCLHFRAIWKKGRDWGPTPLASWLRVASDGWWPTALRLEVPAGSLPQAHTWALIERDGTRWVERCRDAVVSVVDGFAWAQAVEQPRLERRLADGGWALVRGGRLEEATELADAALEVVPSSAQLHLLRATAWLGRGDAGMAEAAARRALERDPSLVRGYRVLGRALAEQERIDEAVAVARAGVQVDPENGGLHTQLGVLLLRAGDPDGAEAAATEAERHGPNARALRKLREDLAKARRGGS
jgi:tetratricopeptide (TPR) repeat protein